MDTKILYSNDKTKVNYSYVVEGIALRILNTYGLSKMGYIQDVIEQSKINLGIDEKYIDILIESKYIKIICILTFIIKKIKF